ncbi:hypothetical protein DPSP01_010623 [Paraphaeosphaeria sporulosa]
MSSYSVSPVSSTSTLASLKEAVVNLTPIRTECDAAAARTDPNYRWRPRLHLTATRGWINDPCAPGYDSANKTYHLGFQWNPHSTEWGNISWGAALSRDLLAWKVSDQPSMKPTDCHDSSGVFTGCMVPTAIDGKEDGTVTAIYTSVSRLPIHYLKPYHRGSESVALATSTDSGRTWARQAKNVFLGQPPLGLAVTGWRDPFVARWPAMDSLITKGTMYQNSGHMYAIVAGGIKDETPTAFLYRISAHALDKWEYLGPLITVGLNFCPSPRWSGDFGVNWEVSNFVSLSTEDNLISREFLICGVEGRLATTDDIQTKGSFRATNAQMWMCGTIDPLKVLPMSYQFGGKLDHGIYYAGNSFWDPIAQQHIIFGWLLEDDLDIQLRKKQGWAGVISLPRVLKMHILKSVTGAIACSLESIGSVELLPEDTNGTSFTVVSLCAVPDLRLHQLRGRRFSLGTELAGFRLFPESWGQWEMELSFAVSGDAARLGFDIVHSHSERTRVYFEPASESIIVDRSQSSTISGTRNCQEHAPHTLFKFARLEKDHQSDEKTVLEDLRFHVLYDCSVLEIFVNERTALTTRVYPVSGTSNGVRLFIEREHHASSGSVMSQILSCDLWPLSLPS